MTHFVRPVALADSLVSQGLNTTFIYTRPSAAHYLADKPYSTGELKTMPAEDFLANIAEGKPLFPADVFRRYAGSAT